MIATSTFCKVRLYKSASGGAYIDLDDIQGPTLKFVENYGVTGSLTIVNDIESSTRNLLSSSCNLWSSGTGAMRTGMFLKIYKGSISSSNQIGVFMITTLEPSDDQIHVTFGDRIQLLRATGADYFRNHYSGSSQHNNENTYAGWSSSAGKLYLEKPESVTIDAANGDVQWAVNDHIGSGNKVSALSVYKINDSSATYQFTLDADWLFSLTFTKKNNALNCRMRYYIDNSLIATQTYAETGSSTFNLDYKIEFSNPVYVRNRTIKIVADQITDTYGFNIETMEMNGATLNFVNRGITEFETGSESNRMILTSFETAHYEYATSGEQDPEDSSLYYVTGIEGVSSIDSSIGLPAFDGRARITYLITEGGLPMSTVFQRICEAAGVDATTITSTREVGIMRCGGSNFHDYLLALADMDEPTGSYSGRQHAIAADPSDWDSIRMGYRHLSSDASEAELYYAHDGAPSGSGTKIVMMSFAPSQTMQYRPIMAVTRGTKDDGTPIILAMRDPDVLIGSTSPVADSSVTTVEDAGLSSYSEIITNRSKNWEGKVQLSGIYDQFMTYGTYVGGVPIRIHDSRYGMDGYAARVKEVEIDISQQTTILTLNNYSEMYANAVVDSSRMAYSAGSFAVVASSSDLFTVQYVRVETETVLSDRANHTIEIYSSDTGYVSAPADVIKVLDLGVAVLAAYFKRGVGSTVEQYGITRIRVDRTTVINIDSARRPDKYSNQSLVVNVQMNL